MISLDAFGKEEHASDDSVSVVRVSDGTLIKTFSGGVSLFKADDLSPIGFFAMPGVATPYGVCSDGVDFWVSFNGSDKIGRF